MPHRSEHSPVAGELSPNEATLLADSAKAFGSPTRLRILWALVDAELRVGEISLRLDLEQSTVSHQLRLLRQYRLVNSRRDGKRIYYRIHDHHVPEILAALRHHHEHVNPPAPEPGTPTSAKSASECR